MSRLFWIIALVVIAIITALTVVFILFQHWIAIHTGTDYLLCGHPPTACPNQPFYNAWSGSVSDIAEITLPFEVLAGMFALYKVHFECHNAPCHKPFARVTKEGHKLCHTCITKHPDELELIEAHPEHFA